MAAVEEKGSAGRWCWPSCARARWARSARTSSRTGHRPRVGLIATLILLHAKPLSYGGRVLLLAMVGLAIWLSTSAPGWNWYSSGAAWALSELGEQVGGWTLAGLVLAKVVPRS
jgi:hypothetical protein